MYENHTQNCLEDEFLGPHRTCMARPMENEGPKRRAEVCALADQLGLILQRRIAMVKTRSEENFRGLGSLILCQLPPLGDSGSVRSVRVRPDGLMMLITYVIHRTVDDHRSNRTRPARPARPGPSGPSGSVRVRISPEGWVCLTEGCSSTCARYRYLNTLGVR